MILTTYDLNQFKKSLLELKSDIISDIEENNQLIKSKTDIIGSGDIIDKSFNYLSKELSVHLSTTEQKKLKEINEALLKVNNKQYGKCSICYKQIDINRLNAIPYTNFCLNCKKKV